MRPCAGRPRPIVCYWGLPPPRIPPKCEHKQREVPGLAEYHLIDRLEPGGAQQRIARGTSDRLTVSHQEWKGLLGHRDSNLMERRFRKPGELRPSVDKQLGTINDRVESLILITSQSNRKIPTSLHVGAGRCHWNSRLAKRLSSLTIIACFGTHYPADFGRRLPFRIRAFGIRPMIACGTLVMTSGLDYHW